MSTAARIASTAIVSNSSMSVTPMRLHRNDATISRDQTGPGIREQVCSRLIAGLVQPRILNRVAGMRGLDCAAAEQFVLLLQQLLNFPQLANLFSPLLNRIGKGGLARLGSCPQRAVKT